MTTVSIPTVDVPATPESLVPDTQVDPTKLAEQKVPACAHCGRAWEVGGAVVSQHSTSRGTVLYTRCECGILQIRLIRPLDGERPVAQGRFPVFQMPDDL